MNNVKRSTRFVWVALSFAMLTACGSDEEGSANNSNPGSEPANSIATSPRGNGAPTIWGVPRATVASGSLYQFRPSVQDPEGDVLTYTIANRPPWAAFDRTSGRLQGIPGTADAGSYDSIKIAVTDGQNKAELAPFKIAVNDPNAPASSSPAPSSPVPTTSAPVVNSTPTISGAAPTAVLAGTLYSFLPSADDGDGDLLTFTITNKPSWATFNATTGRLHGTPTGEHVGTYSNITIRVGDGIATRALPAFAITVTAIANGAATLSWAAPTQNEDGSSLTDLAGYKVHWGTTSGSYANTVTIDNPGVTMFVVENLVAGTWYFTTSAFNSQDVESNYSNEASKTIQ